MPLYDSKSLTKMQFDEILHVIGKHHRFGRGGRNIKYIRPFFDTRDGAVYRVEFDSVIFDFRDYDEPMYDRIMNWLNDESPSKEQYEYAKAIGSYLDIPPPKQWTKDAYREFINKYAPIYNAVKGKLDRLVDKGH